MRGGGPDGAKHALVEVAELLSAESGGAATDPGDLDMSTVFDLAYWSVGPWDLCDRSDALPDRFLPDRVLLHQGIGALDNFFVVAS